MKYPDMLAPGQRITTACKSPIEDLFVHRQKIWTQRILLKISAAWEFNINLCGVQTFHGDKMDVQWSVNHGSSGFVQKPSTRSLLIVSQDSRDQNAKCGWLKVGPRTWDLLAKCQFVVRIFFFDGCFPFALEAAGLYLGYRAKWASQAGWS